MAPKPLILTPYMMNNVKTQVNEQFWSNLQSFLIFDRGPLIQKTKKKVTEIGQKNSRNGNDIEIAKNVPKLPKTVCWTTRHY